MDVFAILFGCLAALFTPAPALGPAPAGGGAVQIERRVDFFAPDGTRTGYGVERVTLPRPETRRAREVR
jgi:hypothetical protein